MIKPVFRPRTLVVVFSALIFVSLLMLNLPLLAAGPAPAQDGPSGPRIWLQENQPLPVIHRGAAAQVASQGQPVSITSGDLDADGFDDLVVGYRTSSGGFISVHRGNIDAFAPQSDASFQAIARGEFPSPFLLEAQTFNVSISPDFIALGNFIGNGNMDLAVASKGGSILYLFPGDGKGGFGDPQTVNVGAGITALASGRLSRTDTLIVGGERSLTVYACTPQGLTALASYAVSAPVSNILFGDFGDPGNDVAFLSGGRIQILRSSTMQLTTVSLPVTVRAFALGTFIFDRSYGQQIALVAPDGSVNIAARAEFDPRVYTVEQFGAIRQAKMNRQPAPAFVPPVSYPANGWKIVESFPGAAAFGSGQAPVFFRTRAASNGADDVMVLNAFSGQLTLISHPDAKPGAQTFLPGQVSLRPYSGTPIAALPMRINVDGRPGVMAIHQGEIAPSMIMPIPDPTFTVNTTTDLVSANKNACKNNVAGQCSLRQAVLEANATAGTDTIMLPAGTYPLTLGRTTGLTTPPEDANTGTLNVNDSVNIIGGGQSTTTITWGTPSVGTVDMVMAVNEDINIISNATAHISNLTIQNGVNHGASGADGDGGCMEFDTGSSGTATLTLTNVTLQNCSTLQGSGGGIVIFNFVTPAGAGGATISNSIIQGNSVVNTGSAGLGGGIVVNLDAHMTMTNSQVKNNSAVQNCTPTCGLGAGGGIIGFTPQNVSAATGETFIHASTISGNKSAGFGAGINTNASISIDTGTVISGNIAGTDGSNNTAHANQEGGGLYLNPAASCPSASTCTATLNKVTITGNQATGNGGGLSYGNGSAGTVGALTMSFSRLVGNTTSGGSGSNLSNNHGTATVTDNWWGTNTASSTINTISGTTTFDPFIVLTFTASPNLIRIGDTSTLTADFLHDNHGTAITASNLDVFSGLPVTFNNANHGTISNAQPFIENQVNISTVSETGCASPPVVPCTATVTVTTSTAHGFSAGQTVTIAGVTDPTYDGVFNIVSTPTTTTFTYSTSNTGTTSSSGGTAGVPKGTATATYTATSGGIDQVQATVDNTTVSATITVLFPPQISKQFSVTNIPIFTFSPTTATLTFTITNPNTANALHGIAFTDNLPSGLAIADTTNTNTCGGSLSGDTAGSTSISYSGGTISFNAGGTFTCTVAVDVKGVSDGVQNNTSGNVTATDAGGLTGNFATASITVINPPSASKAFAPISIPFGGTSTLTITVSNTNVNTTLNGITFTDNLPSGMVVATPSGLTNTCSGAASGSGGSTSISLASSTLAPGTSCKVTANVTTNAAGTFNNSVSASATNIAGLTGPASSATLTVTAATTSTAVVSSANPSKFGQSVTFTATVTDTSAGSTAQPTGSVQFVVDGVNFGSPVALTGATSTTSTATSNATATLSVAGSPHTVSANYVNADGNFTNSSGSLPTQTVNKADTTTTVTSSANPSVFGQSVTFTATVSPVAPGAGTVTGTVTFLDGGSPIGSGTISGGIATFTTSALAVGNHTITTNYGGDGNFNGSTGSLTGNPQVVNKANTATTVTSSQNPSVFGQSVTFTATVSPVAPGAGTVTGTVTFLDGGSPIGSGTISGGKATFTTSALAVGNHTITTNYGGDGNFNGSTGSLTGNPQVVNKANTTTTVTSSQNPSVFGQSVTFTATVSPVAPGQGTATGTVTFLDGGSPIGSGTLIGGVATFSTSALTPGNHTITTNYGGDGNFNGSTGSLTGNPQVVNKANTTTTVTSSVNPSVFGQSVTFTATVSPVAPGAGTPVGTVTFLDGGSPIGTGTLSGGIATFATSALAVGNHTITTNYGGDGNFNGSTGSLTGNPQVVNKANTTTTVTSSVNPSVFGQSVTFTATVSPVAPGGGTATGTVTFLDGGSPIGTGTLSGGIATFTTSALAVGNHTITTNYGGDGNFNGSTGSLTGNPQVVNKADTATAVTSSVNPSVFGQSVTFTATVAAVAPGSGTPVGTVTFLDGGSPIGSGTLIGGVATFSTSALATGNHTITTNYGGDGNFNGSTGSLTGNPQVVNKADTSQTVTSSQNPQTAGLPVTFTATVSAVAPGAGTPTGTVTFLDGGNPIPSCSGQGTLSGGVATCTTSSLSAGSHTITTSYSGDGNFNGSTGSLTGNPQVITQATTTTTVAASQGTITLGDTVTFTATVTASAGTAPGIVTFFDGNTPLGSAMLNGTPGNDQATFPTSLLSASGSPHSITATYQGAVAFAASTSSPISETVNPRTSTTGVVLNPTTVVVGQSSTATVTVTDSGSVPPGTPDVFVATGSPATGRTGFTSTLFADGLVLVAGGTDASNNVLNSAEIYSVSNGTFSSTGNLNTARTGAVAVLLPNGKVLIAGGSSTIDASGALNTAELFDPNAGTFAVAGSGSSNTMTAARFGATATLLNTGKVLIAGGINGGGVLNSAELYDPTTDTFTATGNLNAARSGASATLLGTGKVLVAGGSSDGTANGALNSAEVFDPAGNAGAGTFTSVAGANPTLSDNRWQPEAALLLSGKVLIAGGQNSGGALTSADLYDPGTDSFTASNQSMSQARANGSAVALPSGMVLLAGGTTSQAVDLYDADSDRFNTTGSLQQSDAGLVSTLLNNGQVLVVGLTTAATPASDAELYSPSFNPLGTLAAGTGLTSSEATDSFGPACVLAPSTSTASACTSTVTPSNVATSPHTITATYPADAVHSTSNNNASLTVNKADTTTTVTSSVNPSVFGQSVTFTATVSPVAPGTGTPTGTVTFLDGGSPIGTGTLSGGIATFTTSALAVGSHTITTSYGGDGNFNGSTGSLTGNPQVVNKADTTTTVTSSVNPSVFGQSVTFTATVSPVAPGAGTPTGTVTFLDGGSPIGTGTLSGGIATFTTSALAVGSHTITTSYGGDGNFNGSTGSLTGNPQVVNKADTTTTVTSSVNPSVFGQSVTFTATVSPVAPGAGTPTGTVTFLDGGSPIGTGTLSGGIATFTTSALAVGNHTITTSYGGDGNFNGSTGSLTGNPQVVNKADTTTTVTSSVNPSVFGQSVTFTATVSPVAPGAGTPTGTVTFLDGGSPIGTGTLSGGIATFTTSALAVGNHTITTSYGGDGNFNGSTGSLTGNPQVVNKADTTTTVTSSVNPSVFGQSVTFTATVSPVAPGAGTPTGTVTFLDGGSPIGTGTLSGGIATFTTSALAVGSHTITTSYGGDGNFNGSTGSLTGNPQVVNKADTTTTVTSSVNPSVFGQSATFTATVSPVAPGAGTPTGTVTFLDGGSPIGTGTLSGGIATFTTSALAVGSHTITTSYGGDGNFNGSTGSLTGNPQVVNKADTTTTVTSSLNPSALGQSVTFTATVSPVAPGTGTPTGAVTFLDGGNPIGTGTLSGGVATFTTSALSAGNHTITTSYPGDGNFNGSTGSLTGNPQVVVAPPFIAKAFNPNGIPVNGTSTLTFTITNPAANTVAEAGVAFTDSLPSGLVVATPNGLTNTCGGTPTATAGSGTISLNGGTIAVNSSCTLTVNVTSSQAGVYTNTSGNVSSTNGGTGNTASDTLTVAAPPTIAKSFGASAVGQNSTVGVSFTISSQNTSVTLTGISFTDSLPAGLVVATPSQVTDTCGGTVTAVAGSSSITFTGGSLAPAGPPPMAKTRANVNVHSNIASGNCVITVNLLVTGTGTLSNTTGPVSANESGPGTVSNTATLEVVQAATVNKAFGAASLPLNGTTSLTFNIANPNGSTPLVNISLNDPLPGGLVVATPNGLTGSCVASSSITANAGSGSINLTNLNLPAGGSCSFAVNVTGSGAGTKNNVTSNITATFDDGTGTFRPVTGGSASASIVVVAPPVIGKTFLPASIAPNGTAALIFSLTNPSTNTVAETGVAFTDTLPANVVVATPNGLSSSCGGTVTATAGSGSISLIGGTIPPGSSGNSCTITVNVTSSVPGSYTNTTGAVSSTNGGTGNTASATLTVAHANLSITKTHSGNFPRNSTGNKYTIVVSNAAGAGPTDGTTVTVTDTLPNVQNTLVPTAMTGAGWTCNLGTLTCTRSDALAPGGSYPAITLTVTVPQNIQANVTNSATVSGGGDPNSHTANDPTHIGPPIEIDSNGNSLTVSHNNPSSMDFTVISSPGLGPITFSCSGLPFDATCSFNPPSESQLSTTVTMTVMTAGSHARLLPPGSPNSTPPIYALLFPLLGLLGLRGWNGLWAQNRKAVRVRIAMAFAGFLLLLALAGCGGGTGFTGTPAGTFQITVTATSQSTGQSGSTTVMLTVLD